MRSHATHSALAQPWEETELKRDVRAAFRFAVGYSKEAVRAADHAESNRATKLGYSRLARIK